MDTLTLIGAGFFAVVSLSILGLSFTARYQGWAAERLARSVALILTPEVEAMVKRRAAQQSRGTSLGGLAGMLMGLAVLIAEPQLTRQPLGALVWLGIILAGNTVGASITAALSTSRLHGDGLRYARAEAVELQDYVAPVERLGARVAVALAVTVLLTCLVLGASGLVQLTPSFAFTGSAILTSLSIAMLILFEVDGRWVAGRGQPAGSPSQLSWDDALRSGTLRSLVFAPIGLGVYGFALGLAQLLGSVPVTNANRDIVTAAMNIGMNVFVFAGLALAIFVAVSKPQRYFRLRLWPDLAEGL